jgi:GAF domain-containing protein
LFHSRRGGRRRDRVKKTEYTYLSAFVNITRAMSSSLEFQEVLHQIVKSTCETTGSKGCTLMLLDEGGEQLEVVSSYGLSDHYIRKGPLSADKSIFDTLKGKPIIIEDAASDPRVQYPLEAKQEGIASIVSLPIILREKVIGVLRLYTAVPCRFTEDDIDFLSAIAMQSGLAIENAKMYEYVRMDYRKQMSSSSATAE